MYIWGCCAFIGAIILNFMIPNKKCYFFVLFLFMAIVVGIRDFYTGTDTLMYYSFVDVVAREGIVLSDQSNVNMEIGFRTLMFICGTVLDSPQSLIFISSIITYALFARYLYKNSGQRYYYIAAILFIGMGFFIESMNTMRQLLALSIAVNGLDYLKSNQYIKAIIILVISSLIHSSMALLITLIAFYIIANKFVKKDGNSIVMLIGTFLLMALIGVNISNFINNNIELIGNYAVYYTRMEYATTGSGGWSRAIFILFVTIVFSFFYTDRRNRIYNMMLILASEFALISIYLTNTWMFIFYRLYYEFYIFVLIMLINILQKIRSPIGCICFQLLIILISGANMYKQLNDASDTNYNVFF